MQLTETENAVDATFATADPVRVKVHRQGGAQLFERYTFTSADPLANDQDWHLVIWARLLDDAVIKE